MHALITSASLDTANCQFTITPLSIFAHMQYTQPICSRAQRCVLICKNIKNFHPKRSSVRCCWGALERSSETTVEERKNIGLKKKGKNEVSATVGSVYVRPPLILERRFHVFLSHTHLNLVVCFCLRPLSIARVAVVHLELFFAKCKKKKVIFSIAHFMNWKLTLEAYRVRARKKEKVFALNGRFFS